MEGIVKKYQNILKKVREETNRWESLNTRLLSQFRNASSIIDRLKVVEDSNNYGILKNVYGFKELLFNKQIESLQSILLSINDTLEEFRGVVTYLKKTYRDGAGLVKGSATKLTSKQLRQRVGVKPCIGDCIDGLMLLLDMYQSEYHLKLSLAAALTELASKPSSEDLSAIQQLLIDQPNIPKEEVSSAGNSSTAELYKILRPAAFA